MRAYLALAVLGAIIPLGFLMPWLLDNGPDIPLLVSELTSTRIGAFFGADVVITAIVLFVFIAVDGARERVAYRWLPVLGTLTVGVSFGLPLYLYLRERGRR
jgi:hypothetical protein